MRDLLNGLRALNSGRVKNSVGESGLSIVRGAGDGEVSVRNEGRGTLARAFEGVDEPVMCKASSGLMLTMSARSHARCVCEHGTVLQHPPEC